MILNKTVKKTAQILLDWDLKRVAEIELKGHDASVYRDRQMLVQNALMADLPVEKWPRECRDVLQALLEVTMTGAHVMQHAVGPLQNTPPKIDPPALKKLATDLGVIESLRAVAPRHWAEEKK